MWTTEQQSEYTLQISIFGNHTGRSENENVSRNAIHKGIKLMEKKLLFYEDKLSLYKKSVELGKIIEKIDNKKLKDELERFL